MKKFLLVCMIAVMTMAVFVGCSQNDQTFTGNDNQVTESQANDQATENNDQAVQDNQGTIVEDGVVMDPSEAELIGEDKAKKIALAKVDGATADDMRQFDLDYDDGKWVYEGEIYKGDYEYEFEINAETGKVISWEKDHIYD